MLTEHAKTQVLLIVSLNRLHLQKIYLTCVMFFSAKQYDQRSEVSTESSSTDTRAPSAPEIQKDFASARRENVKSDYLSFPEQPFPSTEDVSYTLPNFTQPFQVPWTTKTTLPTEDKMGSLHNSIPPLAETSKPSASSLSSCVKEGDLCKRHEKLSQPVRFMPRITHLESRKRKLEETVFFLNETETLIGPKLPELPKLDMEDHSLNVTANLIRQTMTKVSLSFLFLL